MGQDCLLRSTIRQNDIQGNFLIRPVKDDCCNSPISVFEGSSFQGTVFQRTLDADGAGANELAEVAEIIIGTLIDQLVVLGICDDRGRAVVSHVVGSAVFVQHHIPVDPADCPVVQITDDIVGVAFAEFPGTDVRAAFLATLGEQQVLIGECVVDFVEIFELIPGVPVKSDTPYIFGD